MSVLPLAARFYSVVMDLLGKDQLLLSRVFPLLIITDRAGTVSRELVPEEFHVVLFVLVPVVDLFLRLGASRAVQAPVVNRKRVPVPQILLVIALRRVCLEKSLFVLC